MMRAASRCSLVTDVLGHPASAAALRYQANLENTGVGTTACISDTACTG